jgi:hypothetical protein
MDKDRLSGLTKEVKHFVDSLHNLTNRPLHEDTHESTNMFASLERHQYITSFVGTVDSVFHTPPIGLIDENDIQASEKRKAITATPAHSAERTSAFKERLKALPDHSGGKRNGGSGILSIESHTTMNTFVTAPEEVLHECMSDYGVMTKVHDYKIYDTAIPEEDTFDNPGSAWQCSSLDRAQHMFEISEGVSNHD